ncbi:MAG: ribonuclease D [Planctomycetes bacterium]|nr:ribonuclease D [Planctomycetota bacterium]
MYIEDSREIASWMARATSDGRFGIDLEFIRERTYYPKLALIQISVGDDLALIDPLADLELGPLIETIDDPAITKVVHAGSQDMEILEEVAKRTPCNVFDTQIAASFLGLGLQPAYSVTCERILGQVVAKGESWTDWLRRPLSDSQERYALDDVKHLLPLHDRLQGDLSTENRLSWALDEMEKYSSAVTYHPLVDNSIRRVKRSGSLDGRGLSLLRQLYLWREEEAKRCDRPRRRILSDELLVEIARRAPQDIDSLDRIRGIDSRDVRRSGKHILAAVKRGLDTAEDEYPLLIKKRRLEPREEAALELVTSALRALCRAERIAPPLVGKSDDVEDLLRDFWGGEIDASEHRLLSGWRGELFGKKLLGFLEGDYSIAIDADSGFPELRPSR